MNTPSNGWLRLSDQLSCAIPAISGENARIGRVLPGLTNANSRLALTFQVRTQQDLLYSIGTDPEAKFKQHELILPSNVPAPTTLTGTLAALPGTTVVCGGIGNLRAIGSSIPAAWEFKHSAQTAPALLLSSYLIPDVSQPWVEAAYVDGTDTVLILSKIDRVQLWSKKHGLTDLLAKRIAINRPTVHSSADGSVITVSHCPPNIGPTIITLIAGAAQRNLQGKVLAMDRTGNFATVYNDRLIFRTVDTAGRAFGGDHMTNGTNPQCHLWENVSMTDRGWWTGSAYNLRYIGNYLRGYWAPLDEFLKRRGYRGKINGLYGITADKRKLYILVAAGLDLCIFQADDPFFRSS